MPDFYTTSPAPLRHDDPRRRTRASRIAARKELEAAMRAAGLHKLVFNSHDPEAVKAYAEKMGPVLEAIGREVYIGPALRIHL